MHVLNIDSGVSGYCDVVSYVKRTGHVRYPRGLMTLDAGPLTIVMHDINYALPLHVGRNVNRAIAVAEAVQLIGGFSSPRLLTAISQNFQQFIEPNGYFHGAYGTRIGNQLSEIVRKLQHDRDSRQAVIALWDSRLDNEHGKRDYPCTLTLHFAIVKDTLEMTTTMRSQDVWLGAPFDWFQFTQMQHTVARLLCVTPGLYRHITLSTHLYSANMEQVENLTQPPAMSTWEKQPQGIGTFTHDVHDVMHRAQSLTSTQELDWTPSERWYRAQLTPYMG